MGTKVTKIWRGASERKLKEKLFGMWPSPWKFSPDCIFIRQQIGTRVNLPDTQMLNGRWWKWWGPIAHCQAVRLLPSASCQCWTFIHHLLVLISLTRLLSVIQFHLLPIPSPLSCLLQVHLEGQGVIPNGNFSLIHLAMWLKEELGGVRRWSASESEKTGRESTPFGSLLVK